MALVQMPDPVDPPSVADGIERSLDPRIVALDRTIGRIVTAVVALALLAVVVVVCAVNFVALSMWTAVLLACVLMLAWAAVVAGLAWHSERWPEVVHRHARYTVDADGVEIRRGVWWRTVVTVPRSRVQHTDVSQGPLERRYGLSTVVVYTAGTQHAKVELRGVDEAIALRIRDHLLPRERHDGV